jgi:hypothetical protein
VKTDVTRGANASDPRSLQRGRHGVVGVSIGLENAAAFFERAGNALCEEAGTGLPTILLARKHTDVFRGASV